MERRGQETVTPRILERSDAKVKLLVLCESVQFVSLAPSCYVVAMCIELASAYKPSP